VRHVVVRYKVRPERLAEHEALIAGVFAQLEEFRPAGLAYQVLKLADGLSFVHLAAVSSADNPLSGLPAFRAFTANIKERCEEPPVSTDGARIGSYDGQDRAY
jgi:hypothetical protein